MYTMLGECTLLFLVRTYEGDHRMYTLQTVQRKYVGPPDVRYFLKYTVVHTWMYEATFRPVGKNHRMYVRVGQTSVAF
jgi:hypothetical protein